MEHQIHLFWWLVQSRTSIRAAASQTPVNRSENMIHISRGVRIRLPFNTLVIATTMAAFRRLASIVNRLNVWSAPRNELLGAQTTTGGRTQRCLAVGVCLAAGGAVAFYFYNDTYSQRCRKRMGYNFSGRDLLPVLSAVEAQQKVQASILHYVLWQDSLWKMPRSEYSCPRKVFVCWQNTNSLSKAFCHGCVIA